MPFTRRRFLRTLGAGALGLGTYAWRIEPHWVTLVRRPMPLRGLPGALHGKTLVQVSDLHVGPTVDADYLRRALARLADLRPDVLVLTGDVVTATPALATRLPADLSSVLGALPPTPLGRFACLGNHDFGVGWKSPDVAAAVAERLGAHGIHALRNAAADLGGLPLAGLDDFWAAPFQPEAVLAALSRDRDAVVLSHNPDTADLDIWGGLTGWILSGHTHGGQVKPPFLPPPLVPVANRRYTQGAFDVGSGRHLYVNPGLGYHRRVRLNVRPEITVFTLQAADA